MTLEPFQMRLGKASWRARIADEGRQSRLNLDLN